MMHNMYLTFRQVAFVLHNIKLLILALHFICYNDLSWLMQLKMTHKYQTLNDNYIEGSGSATVK